MHKNKTYIKRRVGKFLPSFSSNSSFTIVGFVQIVVVGFIMFIIYKLYSGFSSLFVPSGSKLEQTEQEKQAEILQHSVLQEKLNEFTIYNGTLPLPVSNYKAMANKLFEAFSGGTGLGVDVEMVISVLKNKQKNELLEILKQFGVRSNYSIAGTSKPGTLFQFMDEELSKNYVNIQASWSVPFGLWTPFSYVVSLFTEKGVEIEKLRIY